MRNILIMVFLATAIGNLQGQNDPAQSFEVKVSVDSILLGNYLEIQFTAQNITGEFEAPQLEDFEIVGGPNQSTSMSMINGETSQSASYSYFIKPKTTGVLHIEPAYFHSSDDQSYETPPIDIYCLPNPEGIVQNSRIEKQKEQLHFGGFPFFDRTPAKPKKKKLKVTKI
ncbi:MAG: BatD family protein [Saprospiraceae bacterium]|nr:BatD family protein [Saprospiraceae bacterium]